MNLFRIKILCQPAFLIFICAILSCSQNQTDPKLLVRMPQIYQAEIVEALKKSGSNHKELTAAITQCPKEQTEALGFLLANMPKRDYKSLSASFMLNNINLAYLAMDSVKWRDDIPNDIFLNFVLPYVNLHERRDDWRNDFFSRFMYLVVDLESPGKAAVKLNNEIWDMINVHYSTKRKKADQSPYESMESGLASCTGLSIILIDACRAVGVPARFVGVPLWADHSGNHSWVEVWDNGWHFIGAGEPGPLDKTWFAERAESSNDGEWKYSIYATSFQKTNVVFPPLFDKAATYVYGDIVTDRYSKKIREDDLISMAIRLYEYKKGPRLKEKVTVLQDGKVIGEGYTRDESKDFNDFLIIKLMPEQSYQIKVEADGQTILKEIKTDPGKYQFHELYLK